MNLLSFDVCLSATHDRQNELDLKWINDWRFYHPISGRKVNLEKKSDQEEMMSYIKRIKPKLIMVELKPYDSEDVCSFMTRVCVEQNSQGRSFGLEGGLHLGCWRNADLKRIMNNEAIQSMLVPCTSTTYVRSRIVTNSKTMVEKLKINIETSKMKNQHK